jgi:hypothetical protein
VAKLEVSHRKQLLFEQVCKSAARLAKNYITAALTQAKIVNPKFSIEIDKNVLAWRVTRDYCLEHISSDIAAVVNADVGRCDDMIIFAKMNGERETGHNPALFSVSTS